MVAHADPLELVRMEHGEVAVYQGLRLHSFATFRDEVVFAAIDSLERKIEELRNSQEEVERTLAADSYAELHQSTVESFLLATQSMHERALRGLMTAMARKKAWSKAQQSQIQRCSMTGKEVSLRNLFLELFDAPMDLFGLHDDLLFLNLLGNALRHGDGNAAMTIHKLAPSLWINWLPPGTVIANLFTVPLDAPRHPALDSITLPRVVLEQMFMAVAAFWEDIEFVRCNSFSRQSESTEKHSDQLRSRRAMRSNERVWVIG
ncbi:hypothetical protein M0D45_16745 [Xanthomonas prunicola]|uniref:hypothetical protein n=1 Tax=Xanthomonas prunicola TaxID=2053930 RepID=UPI0021B41307|nr:hypothetical protein [Xanthomonas prunicola]UXA52302.1 hypothetical protein M0D45_16745 [Xanthomonas prunicola]